MVEYFGNKELLNLPKTAFLASSTIPLDMVLRCYDWATAKHEGCVVSGFSSKLERDVLHFLIKAKCSTILVLARRMYSTLPDELKEPVEQGRMLIISMTDATRQSRATALSRNRYICELADELLFVGVSEESSLFPLKEKYQSKLTQLPTSQNGRSRN